MDEFIRLVNNPLRFRFFLFIKLPAAFLAGVRLKFVSPDRAEATVRFQYWTKNPFRSTYFACLGMAAEMSTGILAMAHLYKRKPAISMLVTRIESDFYKKAVGITTFTCDQGHALRQAIDKTAATGEAVELVVTSIGRNEEGLEIARFQITWSFKRKA
ncbi:MAG: hypothetical protein RL316_1701 [Bacteroidota bacterium]|jgi:hypothetical protein